MCKVWINYYLIKLLFLIGDFMLILLLIIEIMNVVYKFHKMVWLLIVIM